MPVARNTGSELDPGASVHFIGFSASTPAFLIARTEEGASTVVTDAGAARYSSMKASSLRCSCWISFEPVEGSLSVLADYIGPHKIMWATDYPHSDGFFTGAHRSLISRGEAQDWPGVRWGFTACNNSSLPGTAKSL
jgi:hypothetical protein